MYGTELERCERCHGRIGEGAERWLDYDTRFGKFFTEVEEKHCDGSFPFHSVCAERAEEDYRRARGLTEDL